MAEAKLTRTGQPPQRSTAASERNAKILAAWDDGQTTVAIGEQFGVSAARVTQIAHAAGRASRRGGPKPDPVRKPCVEAPAPGTRADVEPVSRAAAGRSAAATSERMDVTAGETATIPGVDPARFASAMREHAKAAAVPVAKREVPVEQAKQEPHLGRTHTNGCFGSRYDLRAKGLLIECGQCDRSVTAPEAAACRDRFCKVGKAAAAKQVGFA